MEPEEVGAQQAALGTQQVDRPTGAKLGGSPIRPTGSLYSGATPQFTDYQSYLDYVSAAESQLARDLLNDPDDESFFGKVGDFASGVLTATGSTARGVGAGTLRLIASIQSITAVGEQMVFGEGASRVPGSFQWRVKKLNDLADSIGRAAAAERGADLVMREKDTLARSRADADPDLGEDWGTAARVIAEIGDTVQSLWRVAQDDPEAAFSFAGDMLGTNAPQLAAVMGVSAATGGAALPTLAAGVTVSTAFQTNDAIIDPITKQIREVSARDAGIALASGTAAGLLEAIGVHNISRMANSIAKSAKTLTRPQQISLSRQITNTLVASGKGGAGESVTETLQTVIENAGAKYGWDPNRAFEDGVGEAAIAGLLLGNVMSGANTARENRNYNKIVRDNIASDQDQAANLPVPAPAESDLEAYAAVAEQMSDEALAEDASKFPEGDPRIAVAETIIEARAAATAEADKAAVDLDQPVSSPDLFDGTVSREPQQASQASAAKESASIDQKVAILEQKFLDAEEKAFQEAKELGLGVAETEAYVDDAIAEIDDLLSAARLEQQDAAKLAGTAPVAPAQPEPAPAATVEPEPVSLGPDEVAVNFFNDTEEGARAVDWSQQGISVEFVSIANTQALSQDPTRNLRIKKDLRGDHVLIDGRFLVPARKRKMDVTRDREFRILYDIDGIVGGGGDTISGIQKPVVVQEVEGSQNNEYTIVSKGELSYKETSEKPAQAPSPVPAAEPVATAPAEPTPEPAQAEPLGTDELEVYNLTARWAKEQGEGSAAAAEFNAAHADGNAAPADKRSFVEKYGELAQNDPSFGWDVKDTLQGTVRIPRIDIARLRHVASNLSDEALVNSMRPDASYPARLAYADEATRRGIPVPAGMLDPADMPAMSQADVNKLNRKGLVSEATQRGFESADKADSATLYDFLVGQKGLGSVVDQIDPRMTEAEGVQFIIENTENKAELIEAIEAAKALRGTDLSDTPERLFFDWMRGGGRRIRVNKDKFVASYGPMLEGTPGNRMFLTKSTALEASKKVGASKVYNELADLVSDFNAENDTNITEDEAISFMQQGSPAPSVYDQALRNGLDRFKELTGRRFTVKETELYNKAQSTEEHQQAQLSDNISEVVARIIEDNNLADAGPYQIIRFAKDLTIPFGRPDILDGMTEADILQIASEIEHVAKQKAREEIQRLKGGSSAASPVTAEEVTGTVETDSEKGAGTEGDQEADVIVRMGFLPDWAEQAIGSWVKGAVDRAKKFDYTQQKKKLYRSEGAANRSVFNRLLQRDRNVGAHIKEAEFHARELRQQYAILNGDFDVETDSQLRQLRAFLTGQTGLSSLPASVQSAAMRMRLHIDVMSKYLIESGATPDEVSLIIDDNMGIYMNRSFRAHDDTSKWTSEFWARIDNGDPEAVKALSSARAYIKHRIKHYKARKNADNALSQMLGIDTITAAMRKDPIWRQIYDDTYAAYNVTNEAADSRIRDRYFSSPDRNPFGKVKSKKLTKNLGILKQRKNLKDWELVLLGEHIDPRFNYVETISKISMLLETHVMLKDFRDSMPDVFLNEDQFNASTDPDLVRISKEGNEKMAPLDGYYVDKYTAQLLDQTIGPANEMGSFYKWYLKAQSLTKIGKTVYSAQTQSRNFFGAAMTIPAQGHLLSPESIRKNANLLLDYGVRSKKGTLRRDVDFAGQSYNAEQLLLEITKLGVLNDTGAAGELSALLGDAGIDAMLTSLSDPINASKRKLQGARDIFIRKPQQFYALADNIFKMELFEKEVSSLKKIYPSKAATADGMSEIFQEAAEIVRNQSPTYSLVSPFVQKLRRFPGTGPFVSYNYESIRNTYNTLKRAHYEYNEGKKTGNKELVKRSRQRLLGLSIAGRVPSLMYKSIGAGLSVMGLAGSLDDERDEAAIRRLAPPFYRQSEIVPITRDAEGNVVYTVASYANIYSAWQDPIASMYRSATNEVWDDASVLRGMARGALEVLAPYVQEEILFSAIVGSISGRARDGKTVFREDDDWLTKLEKGAAHFAKTVSPGVLIQAENLLSKDKDFKRELLAITTGTRLTDLNLSKSAVFKSYEFKRALAKASTELTSKLRDPDATQEEIFETLERVNRQRMEIFGNAYMDYDAMAYLGRSTISEMLKKGTIGKESADNIRRGKWTPYTNTATLDDEIKTAPDRETRDALRQNKRWLRDAIRQQGRSSMDLPTQYFYR